MEAHHLIPKSELPIKSFHFEDRLFDRDTLFVHQYEINFLYVLKAYSTFDGSKIEDFRQDSKDKFRNQFLDFFNDENKSKFSVFEKDLSVESAKELVKANFRLLNGKCFYTIDNKLLIAQYVDEEKDATLSSFIEIEKFYQKELT